MPSERNVFLNVPFDSAYEPLLISAIATIVALGRTPRCVLELPDHGEGRLNRIIRLMRNCPVSLHDLSRVGQPARFNMPFELGIAVALTRINRERRFALLETERFRLQRTLSDLNGVDPAIHGGTVKGMIGCILSHLGESRRNPSPLQALRIHRELMRLVPLLKQSYSRSTIFSRAILADLIEAAGRLATKEGLI